MHGVGTLAFDALFKKFGFKELILVKEQVGAMIASSIHFFIKFNR